MAAKLKIFSSGLVVGKFSPLHLGHELLIRRAQAHCQRLYLLCYSLPELPGAPAALREKWLKERFPEIPTWVITPARVSAWQTAGKHLPELPENHADEGLHRQFVGEFCREIIGESVQAVFTSEAYGEGFARHLAGYFGHPVEHVSVDPTRSEVRISGTALRENPHALRHFLAPSVYADFIERILLLGGESTGKSSLSQALAQALNTRYVAEYGRECWEARGGQLRYADLLHIAQTQVAREQSASLEAWRYLICDTSPLTTLFYCEKLFGRSEAALQALAKRPYKHIFLCADDFPFVQDGTRQDDAFRREQQAWYRHEFKRRNWPYRLLTGVLEERVIQVLEAVNAAR